MGREILNEPVFECKCDRCPIVLKIAGYDLPEGWAQAFQLDGTWLIGFMPYEGSRPPMPPYGSWLLCAACLADFTTWLTAYKPLDRTAAEVQ